MKVECYSGPDRFRDDVYELLLRHEEQNNLLIGFIRNERKADTADWLMATVKDDAGNILLTAARTPPFKLVLFETDNRPSPDAVRLLASELKSQKQPIPGVLGEQTLARRFAGEFTGIGRFRKNHSMRVMRLDKVAMPVPSPGAMRPLREQDLFFVPYWNRAFAEEVNIETLDLSAYMEQVRKTIGLNTRYIWEDGIPVSHASHSRSTEHGAVLGIVYTPPPYRGHGYASSLVAGLSRALLERGYRFCCLFADAENPVSCGVYRKIGYVERCIVDDLSWD